MKNGKETKLLYEITQCENLRCIIPLGKRLLFFYLIFRVLKNFFQIFPGAFLEFIVGERHLLIVSQLFCDIFLHFLEAFLDTCTFQFENKIYWEKFLHYIFMGSQTGCRDLWRENCK